MKGKASSSGLMSNDESLSLGGQNTAAISIISGRPWYCQEIRYKASVSGGLDAIHLYTLFSLPAQPRNINGKNHRVNQQWTTATRYNTARVQTTSENPGIINIHSRQSRLPPNKGNIIRFTGARSAKWSLELKKTSDHTVRT